MSSYKLPDSIIDRLLTLLANDDSFRACFLSSPRSALASLGFAPAIDSSISAGIWECLLVDSLASKDAIRSSSRMMKQILSEKDYVFFPFIIGVRNEVNKAAA